MRLPNLIVGGAPKCGTTSLYRWLADHPQVCASPLKATRFFVDADSPLLPEVSCHTHGLDAWASYFEHGTGDEPVVCEGTPDYIYERTALSQLSALDPVPHIVFLLRRPSRRVFSLYRFARNNEAVLDREVSFEAYVSALMAGASPEFLRGKPILERALAHTCYADWIERWTERFPRGRIHVYTFEALRADPAAFLRRLAEMFRIDPAFYDDYGFERHNTSYRVRSPALHRVKRAVASVVSRAAGGAARRSLAGAYRRLNVAPRADPPTDDERAVMRRLDAWFAPHDRRLAERAEVDLSLWSGAR